MTDLAVVLVVGLITFSSRVALLLRPRPVTGGRIGRFLEVFPLALFTVIATSALVAPEGTPAVTPALAAVGGGLVGAALFRKSLLAILAIGAIAFYVARWLAG